MTDLTGKTAIITGAARGIGAAIARRFARDGAAVVLADIDADACESTAAEIGRETAARVVSFPVDVADPESVATMVEAARREVGPISVLVNNAGVNVFSTPLDLSRQDWTRCMAVDLEGAWNCARAVLPDMLTARDGAIVNIISNHAFTVMKGTFPYPVAKHALLGLTRSLALEYAGDGVAVNAISPGYTDTRLAQDAFDATGDAGRARATTEAKQPVGRLCRPDEVAAIAALLASDEARFMVGENIVIDGGVSIRMYE